LFFPVNGTPQSLGQRYKKGRVAILNAVILKLEGIKLHTFATGLNPLPTQEHPSSICFVLQAQVKQQDKERS
jgi:hypothetical protein